MAKSSKSRKSWNARMVSTYLSSEEAAKSLKRLAHSKNMSLSKYLASMIEDGLLKNESPGDE